MNNSNHMFERGVTTEALQAYVVQLTAYINENNRKYTKNLQTLKLFYEKQISQLNDSVQDSQSLILQQKNQINIMKDVLQNRNAELSELKTQVGQLKHVVTETDEKYMKERERNKQTYEHIDKIRQTMQAQINKEAERARNAENDAADVIIQLKERESEKNQLKKEIIILEEKLSERYSMPEKMKQFQLQAVKDRTNMENLKKNLQEITRERDFLSMDLEKKKKQNQKLMIQNNKSKGDLSYEIQIAVKKQKQQLLEKMENLKLENERKVYEIEDLEYKLKEKSILCNQLQAKMKEADKNNGKQKRQIDELKADKEVYLEEFRKLKYQYEEVINNLEMEIPQYQKKNWSLEQENKELNQQLDGMQELLRELKAMNDMEPLKKDYRRWAQLNLLADKKLPESKINDFKEQNSINKGDELSQDWEKLMMQIENIQI